MDRVILVENLSKRYRIGSSTASYGTLRDALASKAQQPWRTFAKKSGKEHPDFWALRDVSFDVARGEVLGIIGPNGAGKSTLLKILSRVTYPTTGQVQLFGRVGSLLEVGTGFHPELTGRENIYLNGAILGMKKTEIEKKLDEIIEFAEIERFLNTPVKRYSSGMYMRLAFSVAAHLEPEILIIDEVLAVGDLQFQKKCLGKMQDVAASDGRTILFVSHNMDAIRHLCSKCILLENGRPTAYGGSAGVVAQYLSRAYLPASAKPETRIDLSRLSRVGTGEVRFLTVAYSSQDNGLSGVPYSTGPLEFVFELESNEERPLQSLAVNIRDMNGNMLVNADTVLTNRILYLREGINSFRLRIKHLYLNPGVYRVGLWVADPIRSHSENSAYDYIESAFELEVVNPSWRGNGLEANALVTCDFEISEIA